jgi:hypothetical protein
LPSERAFENNISFHASFSEVVLYSEEDNFIIYYQLHTITGAELIIRRALIALSGKP